MEIAFVVTTHFSEKLRKNGRGLVKNYIDTLKKYCNYNYTIYLIDNGSVEFIDSSLIDNNIIYIYIKDQDKTGITGAWNRGISMAINDGCDIILNTNDDITFNDTINDMIKVISENSENNTYIYGPITNVGGCLGPNKQERDFPGVEILEVTQTDNHSWNNGHGINGFFNAFTKECFHRFQYKGNLYSTEEKYKINAQESEMQDRLGRKGLKSYIVERCMVTHEKIRGWQQLNKV